MLCHEIFLSFKNHPISKNGPPGINFPEDAYFCELIRLKQFEKVKKEMSVIKIATLFYDVHIIKIFLLNDSIMKM